MPPAKVISLAEVRRTLAARFPEAPPPQECAWESGWKTLEAQGGAILLGAVAEVCGEIATGRLFLERVLQTVRSRREWVALIDPARSFDPHSSSDAAWKKVLIVFPKNVEQAVKATDALLRDGNLPLVLLDLQPLPLRTLGRVPANTWHRFQRLTERSGCALVVLTPQPIVEAARVRITLRGRWGLAAMRRRRSELIEEIDTQVSRRGRAMVPTAERVSQSA